MATKIALILLLTFFERALGQTMVTFKDDSIDFLNMRMFYQDFSPARVTTDSPLKKIFVLKSFKYCSKCFREINDVLATLVKPEDSIVYYTMSLSDSSFFDMKRIEYDNEHSMPNIKNHLFMPYAVQGISLFNNTAPSNSFFYRYGIEITPALVMMNGEKGVIVRYQDMFISGRVKPAITNGFNCAYKHGSNKQTSR
jgi:hypothetical protein